MADTESERTARMILAAVSEPGDRITGKIVAAVGPEDALRLARDRRTKLPGIDAEGARAWRGRIRPRLRDDLADQLAAQTKEHRLQVLIPSDVHWPDGLADLGDALPFALWTRGNAELFLSSLNIRVTMTGARAATAYGVHTVSELTKTEPDNPRTFVSGGAYGIDAAVHRAMLASEHGWTIAVMAGGLGRLYPAGNSGLFEQIAAQGLLVSELPPEAAPTRWRFLARSRLLAAVSAATIIPEAGARSGSLHVAAWAVELGRPVGAVPGPITSAVSAGTHELLRHDMATVVTDPTDVALLLGERPAGLRLGIDYQRVAMRTGYETAVEQRKAVEAQSEKSWRRPGQLGNPDLGEGSPPGATATARAL